MKAALYLRVSTNEQDTTNQLPALEEYVKRHDLEVFKVYKESETGWKNGHQVALAQLLEDARLGACIMSNVVIYLRVSTAE